MKLIAISFIAILFFNQVLAKPAAGCLQVYTVTDNDDCYSVAERFRITEKDFYAMNPGLHHSPEHMCDNLDTDKPYCVCMNTPCFFSTTNTTKTHSSTSTRKVPTAVLLPTKASSHLATGSHSASRAVSPAASSIHFSSNSSSHFSSGPTARPTSTTSPVANSLQSGETPSSASTTKVFSALALGLVMTSTSAALI